MPKIKYYISSSEGRCLISAMDSRHIYNAINKLKRTVYAKIGDNGRITYYKEENNELIKALQHELNKRPTHEYFKPIYKLKRSN
jgi:hypothetical protein